MEGVAIDMLVTFVMLYVALTIVGLDFAIFFAVLSALARGGALLRRHRRRRSRRCCSRSPTRPARRSLVLGAYILVQQLESNVTIPIIMAQRVRLHPAVIAIGVVVVGQLFGFIGLFVAVPILSLIIIAVEEFWVKPIEEGHAEHRRSEIELPEPAGAAARPGSAEGRGAAAAPSVLSVRPASRSRSPSRSGRRSRSGSA